MEFKRLSLKNNMRLIIYILLLTFLFIFPVNAATYNYYFSMSGSGSTCSQASPCKWLSSRQVGYVSGETTAQNKIDNASSDDIINLYFNRGDTWTFDTDAVSTTRNYGLAIGSDDPIVSVDAYGSGAKPKMYGTVSARGTWFDDVPKHNATTGPLKWNNLFEMERNGCSFKNIHIDGIYGSGFYVPPVYTVDDITIESVDVTNFGSIAFTPSLTYGTQNSIITKSLFHTGQQLFRYGKSGCVNCWGGAFTFAPWKTEGRSSANNLASYNVVYDIYGEGIHGYGYTAEYNIVGDTGSYGIYVCPASGDSTNTTIRYNFVIQSSSDIYKNHPGASYHGIVVADERAGGSNSSVTVEVYGNIVINRYVGIMFNNYDDNTSPWASVRIFNNTIIDSFSWNMYVNHGELATAGYCYNNASILYDRTGDKHAKDQYGSDISSWTIENNHFWTTGGSPTVDVDWDTNYVTTDPKLAGEEQGSPMDWDGQSGAEYYKNITFADVTPKSGSSLINTGKNILFEDTYLSNGSDFSVLPNTFTFVKKQQLHDGKWDIGAIIFSESTESKAILKSPVGLDVGEKK